MASVEEDDEVVWKGSPLYNHLQELGMAEQVDIQNHEDGMSHITEPSHQIECPSTAMEEAATGAEVKVCKDPEDEDSVLLHSAKSFMWPDGSSLVLEVEVAKAILSSELLVQEDEEFLSNFVLTEEVMEEYKRLTDESPSKTSSLFSDIVLFSGSVAAVAGAVLYLSEKAKAATAAAALLPTALAAMTSVRIGSKVQQSQEMQHFHQLIELLLSDMKRFKQLVRKSLNLLQGMEMISSGNFLSVNPNTGATMVSSSTGGATTTSGQNHSSVDGHQLAQALCLRSNFPALRHAALKCTVQIIHAYREATKILMEVSPLADHVDMQEHYIAFIEMENFGIVYPMPVAKDANPASDKYVGDIPSSSSSSPNQKTQVTIRELKEAAQVALVQQSEYLRRFSLTFCDRVRDDHELNKAGVLKHIRDLLSTIRKLNNKLSRVLEYHQAMGFDVDKLEEKKNLALMEKSSPIHRRTPQNATFVPLRGIYTSMFSTGLHLQHTLLKLRKLEQYFDELEKSHKHIRSGAGSSFVTGGGRSSSPIPVDEVKLLTWLGGFKEIQAELNACIGCLDEGVSQIDVLKGRGGGDNDKNSSSSSRTGEADETSSELSSPSSHNDNISTIYVDESSEMKPFDEVFEAMSLSETNGCRINGQETDDNDNEGNDEAKEVNRQSRMLMRELRGVLVHKAKEHEFREAQALARQRNEPFGPMDGLALPTPNAFDDSFVERRSNDEFSTSSSDPSDCTVKSNSNAAGRITNSTVIIARSISGQILESDQSNDGDEEDEEEENDVTTYAEIGTDIEDEDFDRSEMCQAVSLCSFADDRQQHFDNHNTDHSSSTSLSSRSSVVGTSGIRSVSTPDLKNLVEQQCDSSYKKFAPASGGRRCIESSAEAAAVSEAEEANNSNNRNESESENSTSGSGWESADELQLHLPLETYRRPQRPSASAALPKVDKDHQRKKRLKQKRDRNVSIGLSKQESSNPTSHYLRLCEREGQQVVHLPSVKPVGFAGFLSQVTEKAKSMRNGRHEAEEEIIGDSSSSSSDESS